MVSVFSELTFPAPDEPIQGILSCTSIQGALAKRIPHQRTGRLEVVFLLFWDPTLYDLYMSFASNSTSAPLRS